MELWNRIVESLNIDSWGLTPKSLLAPVALVILIMMVGRFVRTRGPKMESGAVAGVALIAVIIGAAFFWIFAGLDLLGRSFR
jgi:hypothetical protein